MGIKKILIGALMIVLGLAVLYFILVLGIFLILTGLSLIIFHKDDEATESEPKKRKK